MLRKPEVIHAPNIRPVHNEWAILYPIMHDNTKSIEPKHLNAPVKRKIILVRRIIPPER